jgi:hypothetical protein
MGPRDKDPRIDQREGNNTQDETPVEQDSDYDQTVADTFPASDPPAAPGIIGPRGDPDEQSTES